MTNVQDQPGDFVSRETLHEKFLRHFADNRLMTEQIRQHFIQSGQTNTHLAALARGPSPPQWAMDLAEKERSDAATVEQDDRRRRDGVEKIALADLLALDINDYAPANA